MDARKMRDNARIKDVVEHLGLEVHHAGDSYFIKCPCHDDSHPSAFFKDGDNYVYCTVCQKNINAIDLIMNVRNAPFKEALKELAVIEGIDPNTSSRFSKIPYREEIKASEAGFIGVHSDYAQYLAKAEYKALLQAHVIQTKDKLTRIEQFLGLALEEERKEIKKIEGKLKK